MNAHYVKMKHKCVNKTNIKICIVEGDVLQFTKPTRPDNKAFPSLTRFWSRGRQK